MEYCKTLECSDEVEHAADIFCASCIYGKLNVVVDLDETLISCSFAKYDNLQVLLEMENEMFVYPRPHVDEFLRVIFAKYNVYIWTAAAKDYAMKVLEALLGFLYIPVRILTRNDTVEIVSCPASFFDLPRVQKIKPLKKIGCGMSRTLMIDDREHSFSDNPSNGILVKPFNHPLDQQNDTELLRVLAVLEQRARFEDARNDQQQKR
jgi:TFIIF-interacting CTD phosphatase-like protein